MPVAQSLLTPSRQTPSPPQRSPLPLPPLFGPWPNTSFAASQAFAASANPATKNGLAKLVANGGLWVEQVKAISVTLLLAVVGTAIIAFIVKAVIGLRTSEEVETVGLDLAEHGEEGYHGA